ncbi:MAG: riboflavin synthase [Pseudomonadales bacterium]|nr:riboflavin synthase [Pseudomonadales bacterium]
MFTGIINAIGHIQAITPIGGDLRLRIGTGKLDMSHVALGDSIATNGVCLTVVELPGDGFWADVSCETLSHSTLITLAKGDRVNLEKALTPSTPMGGHIVSGHVDGVGEIIDHSMDGRSHRYTVKAPSSLSRYIAKKGSICLDGVSLTSNDVDGDLFYLNIVPHTVQETTLCEWQTGRKINIEVDVVARYLERLLPSAGEPTPAAQNNLNLDFLAQHGFVK